MKQQNQIYFSRIFILMLFLTLVCSQLPAQPRNAIFRNITSADGLPSTSVTDITQDAFGFIWIGTWNGDYRYDGRTFKKIPSTTNGRYLKADKKGGVWISQEYSAGYYDPYTDNVKKYVIPNSNRFPDIGIDHSGTVWISTTDGMLKLDTVTNQFKKDQGLQSGSIRGLIADGDGELLFLYQEKKKGQIMIGNRDTKGNYTFEPFPPDENNPDKEQQFNNRIKGTTSNLDNWPAIINRINSTGLLIINRYGWAYRTEKNAKWIFKKPSVNNLSLAVSDAKLDLYNNLWLMQADALTRLNFITGESTSYKNDPIDPNSLLPLNQGLAGSKLFFDRQGILWIACFSKGISRLNLFDNDFGLLKDSTGAPVQDVLSALECKDGSYWIGSRTSNNGLKHYQADGKIIKQFGTGSFDALPGKSVSTELSHPFAWSLAQTADGSVWVGGGSPGPNRGGLNRIRPGTNNITRFKYDPDDSLSLMGDWVYSIKVDGSDRVWAFSTKGLSSIDPLTEKVSREINIKTWVKKTNSLNLDPIGTLSGDLLFGDQENFRYYLIDHKSLSVKPFASELTTVDSMIFVHQDDARKIWFVTRKAFGYLDTTLTAIARSYEFAKLGLYFHEPPNMFNSDKQGNIWIATDNGIVQFDPVTEKIKHFGFERGLQGNLFDMVNYRGPSGKIYFGGNGGINIFSPSSIKTNPFPPEMVITDLKLDGQSVKFGEKGEIKKPIFADDEITIGPDVLTISIDFAAIHFAGNNSNQYQYKLDGFDKNWRDGGTIGNATYTNLSPATYTLFIRGINLDGIRSDGKKSIKLRILPPWWRTWGAYSIYLIIFTLVSWRIHLFQKGRTIRLEQEKTRDRELVQAKKIEKAYQELGLAHETLKSTQSQLIHSEKMASLGELTAGIAHEIQNPLNFVNNFSEINEELLAEMKDDLVKGNIDNALAIASDAIGNQQKILLHGKRADAIVKGMLQHSRRSSGVKEPTDINALADEYLRLAYHGLRAKDQSFNATINTDFDESIGKINVIPQDMGRVILNLITNAFYAVTEKKNSSDQEGSENLPGHSHYEPTVSVSTKRTNNQVEVLIKDNGNGIPQNVLDKIFQPFFTTKPTGQGTGLGLSMSYDIIKAHGGELVVETIEGEQTEFIIRLNRF